MARIGISDPGATIEESATSQVKQAEATLSEARSRLDRTKRLTGEGVFSRQQLDEQQAKFDVADATVKLARESVRNIKATIAARKVALELAQKKLGDAWITAPMSGLVKERLVSEGTYLKANSPVVTLVQSSPLKLRVDMPESAIESVRTGRAVRFTVDSLPGRMFDGRISRLSPSVNQLSRTLKLEALVDNSNGTLKPGLFARVTILTGKTEKTLVAPLGALFTVAGLEKLFVIEGGKVSERIVRTGSRGVDYVEIVEGVKEGDVIATSNLGNLQQGREVSTR
jgi:RND family efflux transporter MFP subunit